MTILPLLLALAAANAPPPAMGTETVQISDDWQLTKRHSFYACSVAGAHAINSPDDTRLVIAPSTKSDSYNILAAGPAWPGLPNNAQVPFTLIVTAGDKVLLRAESAMHSVAGEAENAFGFSISASQDGVDLLSNLRRGEWLIILKDETIVSQLSLAGSTKALDAVEACRTEMRARPDYHPDATD